ncbi:MAG: hypothetical protein ABJB66_20360 [Gemmatimonadaceae bacterium]
MIDLFLVESTAVVIVLGDPHRTARAPALNSDCVKDGETGGRENATEAD